MIKPGYGETKTLDLGGIILSEIYEVFSITVKLGQNLAQGAVVALETASGKYIAYNDAVVEPPTGTEIARGILTEAVDATSGDQLSAMLVRAIVDKTKLTGYDAAALVDLNGREIGNAVIF